MPAPRDPELASCDPSALEGPSLASRVPGPSLRRLSANVPTADASSNGAPCSSSSSAYPAATIRTIVRVLSTYPYMLPEVRHVLQYNVGNTYDRVDAPVIELEEAAKERSTTSWLGLPAGGCSRLIGVASDRNA